VALLEIARHAALEVLGLANVKHLLFGPDHSVDARTFGECRQEALGVKTHEEKRVKKYKGKINFFNIRAYSQ
jgi:hypothetical protein